MFRKDAYICVNWMCCGVGWLAPLWPFIGICAELVVLVIIIAIYERQRSKRQAEEARKEEAQQLYAN